MSAAHKSETPGAGGPRESQYLTSSSSNFSSSKFRRETKVEWHVIPETRAYFALTLWSIGQGERTTVHREPVIGWTVKVEIEQGGDGPSTQTWPITADTATNVHFGQDESPREYAVERPDGTVDAGYSWRYPSVKAWGRAALAAWKSGEKYPDEASSEEWAAYEAKSDSFVYLNEGGAA